MNKPAQLAASLAGGKAVPASQATHIEQSRAIAEVQAAFVVAQSRPRSEPQAIEWGRIQNRAALDKFARCLETNIWPGYADGPVEIDLPAWAKKQLERRHERGEFQIVGPAQGSLIANPPSDATPGGLPIIAAG